MKILIITESMVPFSSNWGGCQRIYHYAKKMVSEGIQVSVICHNGTSDRIDGTEDIEGIKVIGHGGRKTPPTASDGTGSSGGFKSEIRKRLQAIDRNVKIVSQLVRSIYRFLYSEPNTLSGRTSKQWAQKNISFVLQHIEEEKPDAVILSGPGFGFFYHAGDIKSTGVKLILDYRDPWVSWYEKPTLASRAERKAIESADLVITTTEPLTAALNKKYSTSKCHTVMNGFDKALWSLIKQTEHNPDFLTISYIGNIKIHGQVGGFRDPGCFISTAEKFVQIHPDVKIRFIGVKDDLSSISPNLKKYIEFRNTVSVAESLKLTVNADVLLIFHTAHDPSGKYIICGKAFDCIRSGNYVLSIGDAAYANKAFIEDNKIGIHCNNDEESILGALETIYKKWKQGSLVNRNKNIEQYSRDYQNTLFLNLLKKIAD